jgi:hypothetical protein
MLVIHTPAISGINLWYPAVHRPKAGILRVVEIGRYRKALPYLLLYDALLILAVCVQIYDIELIWPFVVTILTVLSIYIRRRLIPHTDCRVSMLQSTTTAPVLIIVEHMVYCTGLALVGLSAARFAGDTVRSVAPMLLPVIVILIMLPIANIVVELVRKKRR